MQFQIVTIKDDFNSDFTFEFAMHEYLHALSMKSFPWDCPSKVSNQWKRNNIRPQINFNNWMNMYSMWDCATDA